MKYDITKTSIIRCQAEGDEVSPDGLTVSYALRYPTPTWKIGAIIYHNPKIELFYIENSRIFYVMSFTLSFLALLKLLCQQLLREETDSSIFHKATSRVDVASFSS